MFNESWPWKRDLACAADRLERAQFGLSASLYALELSADDEGDGYEAETEVLYRIERDVMNGAFAVRRLIGMPSKVTKAVRETKATVVRYPLREGFKTPDVFDALGDLDMYDMSRPAVVAISANKLCNLFVHSLILRFAWTLKGMEFHNWWCLNENDPQKSILPNELAGWLVASDKSSAQHLTLAPLPELVRIMRVFAGDEVTCLTGVRDRNGRMHFKAT